MVTTHGTSTFVHYRQVVALEPVILYRVSATIIGCLNPFTSKSSKAVE